MCVWDTDKLFGMALPQLLKNFFHYNASPLWNLTLLGEQLWNYWPQHSVWQKEWACTGCIHVCIAMCVWKRENDKNGREQGIEGDEKARNKEFGLVWEHSNP